MIKPAEIPSAIQPGQICGFFDKERFHLGLIMVVIDKTCSVKLSDGQTMTLSPFRLVIISELIYPLEDVQTVLKEFTDIIDKTKLQFKVDTLWALLKDSAHTFSLEDLLETAKVPADDESRFSLYLALRENAAFFHLKVGVYHPRTEQEYRDFLAKAEQERLDEVFYQEIRNWLTALASYELNESADKHTPVLKTEVRIRLEAELETSQPGRLVQPLYKIFHSFYPHQSHEDFIYLIRKTLGQIDDHTSPLIAAQLLPDRFPPDVRTFGFICGEYMPELWRRDLGAVQCWTIDAETTQDFDDAISLEKTAEGWQLGIHISDVSYFVKPGDLLDKEAFRRTSSIYLPGHDIHMLPESISCEKASLLSGKVRPALSVLCTFDSELKLLSSEIVLSMINVCHRFSYAEFEQLMPENPDTESDIADEPAEGNEEIREKVQVLSEIAHQHRQQRVAAGAILIDDISQTPARRLIAECMVIYNSIVAGFANNNELPMFYRFLEDFIPHQEADEVNMIIPSSALGVSPHAHPALGLPVYAQLTSPLRRYSDLINQRQVIAHLKSEALPYDKTSLSDMLQHLMQTRQRIRLVTRLAEKMAAAEQTQ